MGGVLAGGVSLWAVSPRVVFPPTVFMAAPIRFFCRAWLLPFFVMSVFSAIPASGRPPGLRHRSFSTPCTVTAACAIIRLLKKHVLSSGSKRHTTTTTKLLPCSYAAKFRVVAGFAPPVVVLECGFSSARVWVCEDLM